MEMILGSILPKFSSNDKTKLNRGLDFIGINHYASFYVSDCISSVCESGPGVSTTEGLFLQTSEKDGVPIGELVSTSSYWWSLKIVFSTHDRPNPNTCIVIRRLRLIGSMYIHKAWRKVLTMWKKGTITLQCSLLRMVSKKQIEVWTLFIKFLNISSL
jgi:hypothetical protein